MARNRGVFVTNLFTLYMFAPFAKLPGIRVPPLSTALCTALISIPNTVFSIPNVISLAMVAVVSSIFDGLELGRLEYLEEGITEIGRDLG